MGIIFLQPQIYKCSKCKSLNCEEFSEPSINQYAGHYEGVRCLDCGHEIKYYKQSIMELESQKDLSYSNNPNEPHEF